jgi:hypothetical protein
MAECFSASGSSSDQSADVSHPLHAHQVRDCEFDTDRNHQQRYADIGKYFEGMPLDS